MNFRSLINSRRQLDFCWGLMTGIALTVGIFIGSYISCAWLMPWLRLPIYHP